MSPLVPTVRAADFGPLIVETDVDEAIIARLRLGLPTYLSALEEDRGLPNRTLARPAEQSYTNVITDAEFSDHTLPAVIVTAAQTLGNPERDGNGMYYAAWQVVISSIVRGRNPIETRQLAALFSGCVRRLMVHPHGAPVFGDDKGAVRWVRSNLAPVRDNTGEGRWLAAGINTFTVFVDKVVQEGAGPMDLDPYDPGPDDPDTPYEPLLTVESVTTEIHERS